MFFIEFFWTYTLLILVEFDQPLALFLLTCHLFLSLVLSLIIYLHFSLY